MFSNLIPMLIESNDVVAYANTGGWRWIGIVVIVVAIIVVVVMKRSKVEKAVNEFHDKVDAKIDELKDKIDGK